MKSLHHRLTNRKELILFQEKYFETLKETIISTVRSKIFNYLQFFKVGKLMRQGKYGGHMKLSVVFSDKVLRDIDFTDEILVQYGVLVIKTLL